MKKTISHNTYLKAQGLFHLANESYIKGREYEAALSTLLGCEGDYVGCISDDLFDVGASIDRGLNIHKIKILPVYKQDKSK